MIPPLDELYLRWLYSQVASIRFKTPQRTHWSLLRQLYTTEFVWLVPNDDNRVEDGRDLRNEFLLAEDINDVDPTWMELGCSMLEMLLGLARRLAFEADGEPRVWFWQLIENLGLIGTNDTNYNEEETTEILQRLIWRTYSYDGRGGLFPLRDAHVDQRKVEIWYQLSAYLVETE